MSDAPKYVGDRPRSRIVTLDYPVEYRDVVYSEIIIRRPSVREVRDWAAAANAAAKDGATIPDFPMVEGSIPPEVMDALDPDDDERLDEAISDFLPRRFRAAQESAQAREQAAASSPVSATS